ncbi:MAG: hypothetical protein ACRD8O_15325 [Bryobacteraceae bacterium]
MKSYRVVLPHRRDKARQSTVLSEHATVAEAFAEIDRLRAQIAKHGGPSNAVELIVVDANDNVVPPASGRAGNEKVKPKARCL